MTQQEKQQQEKQETVIKIEKRNFVVPGETIYSRDIPFAAFASEIGNMFRNIFTDCVGVYYDQFTMPNTNMIFPTLSVLFTPNATRGTSDDGRLTALIGKSVNSQSRFERYRARETARVNNVQYTLSDEAKNILAKYIYDNYPLQKVNRKNIKNIDWNAIVTLQKTMVPTELFLLLIHQPVISWYKFSDKHQFYPAFLFYNHLPSFSFEKNLPEFFLILYLLL